MRVLRKEAAGKYLLFCLALVPALLFAYLGQFSRLIWDDYDRLGKPIELGFWQSVQYFRDSWNGDYTNFLLFGLLAPLGALVPSVFPSALIVIWIAGSALLYLQVFTFLEIRRQRYLVAIALASLTVAAAINGLDSQHSFYWLTATVEYTLPPALAIDLPDIGSKGRRASAHPFTACVRSLSGGCDRFYHRRLLGNVPGLSAGVSGTPDRWPHSIPRSIEAPNISCPDFSRFLRDFSQCAGAIEVHLVSHIVVPCLIILAIVLSLFVICHRYSTRHWIRLLDIRQIKQALLESGYCWRRDCL